MEPLFGQWHDANKADVGGLLAGAAAKILNDDEGRLARLELNLRQYGGTKARAIRPWQNPALLNPLEGLGGNTDRLRLNVVKAAIDTITAKVGKMRPRPTFLTEGGDWSTQVKAKQLQRFMDGAYHASDTYELAMDAFRDAMVCGTAVFHPYAYGSCIRNERVPAWELFVERADAMYGTPRCLYRVKWVSTSQVHALYGNAAAEAMADPLTSVASSTRDEATAAGFVRVVEAWCLPCCEPDEIGSYERRTNAANYGRDRAMYNGRHVLLVGEVPVADEDWACPEFPFVFLHWSKPVQGFWGDSAVTEVLGLQLEINKLLQFIQESMQKVAQPFVLIREDALVTPAEITNLIGQVLKVKDPNSGPLSEVIQVVAFNPVAPAVMNHLWMLYSKAFEILGSNQLAASATAPPGLESGRALEQLAEEHSERFMAVSRHFEHVIGELMARQFIRCAKEIDATLRSNGKSEGFVIRAPNGRAAIKLKWSDVSIDEDGYVIQVFPTSVLPTTPAARIQEVERLSAAGWISPSEARRLLNFPDMEASNDLATADEDNLMRQLEWMLERGEAMMPEPYQDLQNAVRVAQQAILRAMTDGVPEAHIDLVRDFITAAEALLKRTQTPNPAVPAGVFSEVGNPSAGVPAVPPAPAPAPQGVQ